MHTKNRLGLFMLLVGSIIISMGSGTAEASEFLADRHGNDKWLQVR